MICLLGGHVGAPCECLCALVDSLIISVNNSMQETDCQIDREYYRLLAQLCYRQMFTPCCARHVELYTRCTLLLCIATRLSG